MIAVKLEQLFLSNMGFVVLLKGKEDERTLPIFIGAAEAQSIAIKMNKAKVPRPLTHDLFKNVLDYLECRFKRIAITRLKEGTFYATLVLERDGLEMELDSRPSDAIALAMRFSAPIFVSKKVMDEAGQILKDPHAAAEKAKVEADKKPLTPVEVLEEKLKGAIADERYEDAAMLRDEIKRLDDPHSDN